MASCVRDVAWVRSVLRDLRAVQDGPTVVFQDNLGAISWTSEVQGLRKVKHVGIRYHYVRGEVDAGTVQVEYCESSKNRADTFTKILIGDQYKIHRALINCIPSTDLA